MKYLWVGDPHATQDDLQDARQLSALVWGVAKEHGAKVVWAGDLYDGHAMIHAEVQRYWFDVFEDLADDGVESIVLKGNHDGPGTRGSRATALLAHYYQKYVRAVIDEPHEENGLLFCPYVHDGQQLVDWSREHAGAKVLFCHQTFNGSKYDNGFFAGDGVEPDTIAQELVISGHIHAPQRFGKIWYPGAPRWRTESDANVDRAIWLLDFDASRLTSSTPIETGGVCRRIIRELDHPDHPLDAAKSAEAKDDWRVTIKGPQSWIDERVPLFEGRAKVRTVRTDVEYAPVVRESEGVGVAFDKYLDVAKPRYGTPKEILKGMADRRGVLAS